MQCGLIVFCAERVNLAALSQNIHTNTQAYAQTLTQNRRMLDECAENKTKYQSG